MTLDAVTEQHASRQPSHSTMLKLLSGLQQGAEARLNEGAAYLIGSSEECDIVLQDESVALRQLTVTVKQGRIQLQVQEQAILVGDRSVPPGQSIDLTTSAAIRLGAVCLGIGPAETDWTKVACPKLTEPRLEPVGETRDAANAAEHNESAPLPQSAELEATPDRSGKPRVRRWAGLGGAGLAILIIALWILVSDWLKTDIPVNRMVQEPSALEKTQAIITQWGLQNVHIEANPGGGVTLTGYCATREIKNRLTAALLAQGTLADNRLWPEDELRESVAYIVDRFGGDTLGYDYLGEGAFRLYGRLRTDMRLDQLLATLQNDVSGVSRIQSEVKTLKDLMADLQNRVRQAGLEQQISLTIEGAGIVATGSLNAESMDRWKALAQTFINENQGIAPLEGRVKLISASRDAPQAPTANPIAPPALPIAVRGVAIGPDQSAYALLSNGTRVAEGDRIEGRYVVEKIQFNRVIARDGAQEKVYYIGDAAYE